MAVAGARAAAAVAVVSVAVSAGVIAALAVVGAHVIAIGKFDDGSEEEQDDVDDGKRPASLQHSARLIGRPIEVGTADANIPNVDGPVVLAGDAGAVEEADAAQVPDAGDKSTDEAEVDETDEKGVGGGAMVGEEGEDAPGEGEDGDDEEDEDGVWGELVFVCEAIDEPGEHAHGRNLEVCQ